MEKKAKRECKCPYCDIPDPKLSPFCGGKRTKLRFCPECGCPIPRVAKHCPECGADVELDKKPKRDE